MKKMNSTSKRKWILSGTLAFGAVALLTTGFATWIIGVNQTNGSGDTTVEVDTTKNESALLEFELEDDAIKLAEETAVNSGFVTSDGGGDLKIKFKSLKFTFGSGFLASNEEIKGIKFSLPTTLTEEQKSSGLNEGDFAINSKVTATSDKNYTNFRTDNPPTGWTYINAPDIISLTGVQPTGEGTVKTYDLGAKEVFFRWGDYFKLNSGNVSPATFYNEKLSGKGNTEAISLLENVEKELIQMKKAFEDQTLKLLIEVEKGVKE